MTTSTNPHGDCYVCWQDFVTGMKTDHAPMERIVTEADRARDYDFAMDGGNFHGDGSLHTGDDDGYHGEASPEGGAWLHDEYGVAYWSPTGEAGDWHIGDDGQPTFIPLAPQES